MEENLGPQNMPLWHKNYFRLVILKKEQTQEKLRKPSRSYPFVRDIYKGKSPFVRVSPPLYQKRKDDSKSLETLISREDNDLNLRNKHIPIYCALPGNLP